MRQVPEVGHQRRDGYVPLQHLPSVSLLGVGHGFPHVLEIGRPFEPAVQSSGGQRFRVALSPLPDELFVGVGVVVVLLRGQLLKGAAREPPVLQHLGVHDLVPSDVLPEGDVDAVEVHVVGPLADQLLHQSRAQFRRRADDVRVVLPRVKGVGQGDAPRPAHGALHRPAYRPAGQGEDGGGVAAVVGPADHEVDGTSLLEEVVEADLHAARRGAVHQDPLLAPVVERPIGSDAVVLVESSRAEIRRGQGLADDVRLADPRPLHMGQDHRYGVAGLLEGVDQ